MVMAKLHIICGNCGSNEHLSYEIDPEGRDFTTDGPTDIRPGVYVYCSNCSTIHNLDDTLKEERNTNA